ncbi:MAG: hypothetical protein ABI197_02050 [Granulicella sp.]
MTTPFFTKAGRMAAITFFAATAGVLLHAQGPAAAASTPAVRPELNLQAALKAPINLYAADDASSSSSSSSSVDATEGSATDRFLAVSDSTQPPPRRRYGRPRYTDSMHNADGSSKYAFQVGGGLTLPTGGTHSYYSPSYAFQGGFGRNFNKNVAVMVDFNWANFGIKQSLLNYQLALYNSIGGQDDNGNALSQLNGNGHIWSFSLDPVYNFAQGDTTGAYITGGVGFYHKTSAFTIPSVQQYCDYYYGCYNYQANEAIDKYTSNAIGVNGGVGFTYKPSRFGNTKLFAEAKFVYTANSRRPYSLGSASSPYFNAFTQNSAPTTFIPITFGIRF